MCLQLVFFFEISPGRCRKWSIVSVYAHTANSSIEEINKFYLYVFGSNQSVPWKGSDYHIRRLKC